MAFARWTGEILTGTMPYQAIFATSDHRGLALLTWTGAA
jgi:hypothetical protein